MPKKNPFKSAPCYRAKPYPYNVYLARTPKNAEEMQRHMKAGVDNFSGTGGVCICYSDDENGMTIIVGWFNVKPSTLAHECYHACMKIMGACGVNTTCDNNEHFAYLMGDMMEYFWSKRK